MARFIPMDVQERTLLKEKFYTFLQSETSTIFSDGLLSPETEEKLHKFHNKAGLIYAAYDFIVDKNGKEIFLECNPNGQWLFVGDKIGNQITSEISNKLIH